LGRAAREAENLLAKGTIEPIGDPDLGPPVPNPQKIIGVGLNYVDHAKESGMEVPANPVLFAKFPSALCGPNDDVRRPRGVSDLDYEAELAVYIGRRARNVDAGRALDYVAGYSAANDVSARTIQMAGGQWSLGKSFDTFCPLGPALVSSDEVPDPQNLSVRCWVAGKLRQNSTTASMVFSVADLIAYCSGAMTLEPGDVILTGTPPGVAFRHEPSQFLEPGQVCEVEVGNLGKLRNRVVDAPEPHR
jgi:2-keto-4-pentenoate hydratase/2-oxohepta-3-ene-1,7-dioic acid hydratase in catechol pathway